MDGWEPCAAPDFGRRGLTRPEQTVRDHWREVVRAFIESGDDCWRRTYEETEFLRGRHVALKARGDAQYMRTVCHDLNVTIRVRDRTVYIVRR